MTLFLPLEDSAPLSSTPSFVTKANEPKTQVAKVIKAILKAKRIVVICGAGISVKAGIPDFRSSEGLFQSLKRDNPKDGLSSGKDLFDASVFNTEQRTVQFFQMITKLSSLSQSAVPTPFHNLLQSLDMNGRLLRVYTQNIDALEAKTGLSFGVPEFQGKRTKPRSSTFHEVGDPGPSTTANRMPRCIPLHGTLQLVHCQICTHSFPLADYLPSFASGVPPECPECSSMERTRQLVGKRARGVGKLRPSVVLYNEAHKDGEGVGEIVQKDLIGSKGKSGADLLLVVGTSLRVPGTKTMVRQFSRAIHSRGSNSKECTPGGDEQGSQQQQQPLKSIYLNIDFPLPTREWEGVFDAWIQGDAQTFAQMLQEELEKEIRVKELAVERRRKREEEIALAALSGTPSMKQKPKTKSKFNDDSPAAKRKVTVPVAGDSDMKRRKLVVEVPSLPKSVMESYQNYSSVGRPPRSPTSPSRLTLRIPRRSHIVISPEKQEFTALSPPSTPIKRSLTIGLPPPTPDYTPGRDNLPRFRTVTSTLQREHSVLSHSHYARAPPSKPTSSTSSLTMSDAESDSDIQVDMEEGSSRYDNQGWKGGCYLPFLSSGSVKYPFGEEVSMLDFKDRLGTSCLRTTQVEVGEGG